MAFMACKETTHSVSAPWAPWGAPRHSFAVRTFPTTYSWSPDGRRLAFEDQDAQGYLRIATVRADGSDYRLLSPLGDADSFEPAYSPDGSQVIYGTDGMGPGDHQTGLCVVNADGTGSHAVGAVGSRPQWAPDGHRIVVEDGNANIVVEMLDGTNATTVAAGAGPDWSPDGGRIVYATGSGLFTVARDGTGAAPVPQTTGSDAFPVWSPDGQSIPFTRILGATAELDTIAPSGNNLRTVVPSGRLAYANYLFGTIITRPAWGPTLAAPPAGECNAIVGDDETPPTPDRSHGATTQWRGDAVMGRVSGERLGEIRGRREGAAALRSR
jgi:Tol biopolymer transport system component